MTTPLRFLKVEEVADELAVSRAQVYSLLRGGDLPAIQIGPKRVWRIERAKLEEYIERQYRATREAIERGDVPPAADDEHEED